ncbi:MAG: membrane protein insertase YidC [Deltaproteobacteria bacterium]|jgi:YidC/Oxa1 family membrane protein insertase|nr:membrane protein insertase YidC [Deltaproteobacteria bacterium]
MEKRVIVTMLVMMGFFMAVSFIYPLIFPPTEVPVDGASNSTPSASFEATTLEGGASANSSSAEESETLLPPRAITVSTPLYRAVFTEDGGRLLSLSLNKYKTYKLRPSDPDTQQELVNIPENADNYPLNLLFVNNRNETQDLKNLRFQADVESVQVTEGETKILTFSTSTPAGLSITRSFTFSSDNYVIKQKVTLKNSGNVLFEGRLGQAISAWPYSIQQNRYNVLAGYINRSFISESVDDAQSELSSIGLITAAGFMGYMDQYFLSAFVFGGESQSPAPTHQDLANLKFMGGELPGLGVRISTFWPLKLSPQDERTYDFDFFYGPKDTNVLIAAGHDLPRSVDLGWFDFLGRPLGFFLRLFYGFVGNYGVAIILVTILIKICLWPLTAKSYKSMKEMQKLQPQMQRIREQYKDNPQAMNQEMLKMYKTHKVSPLGGCLPMVLQIPFFIAFYRVLDYALELRGAPFALWIHDLSAPDRLFYFNFSIPFVAPPTGIPVLTLIMGATMIWQQRMTPTMGDPLQAKIMMFLPLIFIVALLNMPAGLVLYWLVNNILSILQQKLINRSKNSKNIKKGQVRTPKKA